MKQNWGDQVPRLIYFYFQKARAFIEEDNPSEKVVIVEEGLDGINIDDTRNLKDSPRLEFVRIS